MKKTENLSLRNQTTYVKLASRLPMNGERQVKPKGSSKKLRTWIYREDLPKDASLYQLQYQSLYQVDFTTTFFVVNKLFLIVTTRSIQFYLVQSSNEIERSINCDRQTTNIELTKQCGPNESERFGFRTLGNKYVHFRAETSRGHLKVCCLHSIFWDCLNYVVILNDLTP